MKFLSLFSGIGGFEKGIQQAYERLYNLRPNELESGKRPKELHNTSYKLQQWECVGYSEIDKYAVQVYDKQFKHKNYGDITTINPKQLEDFDCLVGGFPCQSFSIAGKRKGFDDTRGTLFFDIARILAEKRPRLLVLENVKGLLSHDSGKTFSTIIGVLTDLGYFIEWQVLNSKNFGVPQNRERVFIVGHLGGERRRKVFPIGESNQKSTRKTNKQGCANTLTGRSAGGQNRRGNYIKQLNKPKHSNDRVYSDKGLSPTINTAQGGNRQPFVVAQRGRYPENPKSRVAGLPTEQMLEPNLKGTSNTLSTVQKDNMLCDKDAKIRRLTPKECERLQGFPDGWTDILSDTQRYKTLGNAVTVNVIEYIFKQLRR